MNKTEFLNTLSGRLLQLPVEEREKHLSYYAEMICDMMEDGVDEHEAVARLGNVSDIANMILHETPLPELIKSRVHPRGGWSALSIVLIVVGFPVWFPILISLAAVALSVYIVIWAVIIALFSVVLAIAVCALALLAAAVINVGLSVPSSLMILGGGAACAGVAILAYFAALYVAKALVKLTKLIASGIKSLFIKKGEQK